MQVVYWLLICTVILVSPAGYSNNFIGSWQLVSGEYVDEKGKLVDYSEAKLKSIKTLSTSHYSFISMSGEKFWAAGAGSYSFTDKEYIETPIHTSYTIETDSKYRFSYKHEGEYWYNSRWKDGKRVEYEVWQKLK